MIKVPDKNDLREAHVRIKPYIHQTSIMTSGSIDELTGCNIFFKCENFQKVGAFKARGAMNAVLSLPEAKRAKGVATHSSGNHAQALAKAAKILNTRAFIVMPSTAPDIKKQGVRAFGGEITECEPTLSAREAAIEEVIKRTGATEVHPFNNYDVIAGQATAAMELFESEPNLDFVFTPVGGGGLLSGTLLATKYFSSKTKVIAGEPSEADDAFRSMQSGKIEPSQAKGVADGLLTSLGDKTFPIIKEMVTEIITVTDEEIIRAMRLIWERVKIIIEPSCAVPFAAVLKAREKFVGKKIGVILTGGNVDVKRAFELFSSIEK